MSVYTHSKNAVKVRVLLYLIHEEPNVLVSGSKLTHLGIAHARTYGHTVPWRTGQNALGELVRDGILEGPEPASRTKGYGSLSWEVADPTRAKEMIDHLTGVHDTWFTDDIEAGKEVTLTFPMSPEDWKAFCAAATTGLVVTAKKL